MSTVPKKPDGTKPAIKPAGGMLNDRRIRLLLAIIGAIVAWMAVSPAPPRPSPMSRWISPMIPLPILPAA